MLSLQINFSILSILPPLNIHIVFDDMKNSTYITVNNVKKNKNDVVHFILNIINSLDIGDYNSKVAVSRYTPTIFNDIHLNSVQTSTNVKNYFETLYILSDDISNDTTITIIPPLMPSISEIIKDSFSTSINNYRKSAAHNVVLLVSYTSDQLLESKYGDVLFAPNGPILVFQITIGPMKEKINILRYTFSAITIHYRASETKYLTELENYVIQGIYNFTQIIHTYDYSTTSELGFTTKATITILGCVGGLLLILLSIIIINSSNILQIQKQYQKKLYEANRVIYNNNNEMINENNTRRKKDDKNVDDGKYNKNNDTISNNDELLENDPRGAYVTEKVVEKRKNSKHEVLTEDESVDFSHTFDILFLVDDSNSVSNSIFEEYKHYITTFLDSLDNPTSKIPQVSRIGVITFNRKPYLNIPFEKYESFKKLKNAINNLNRNGGMTNLGKALNFANGYLLGQKTIETINNNHNNEENVLQDRLQFLILLSDGHTKDTIDWEYQSLLREYSIFMTATISKSYLEDMFIGLVKAGGKLMSLKVEEELTKYIYKKYTIFYSEHNFNK
uniref:VWFA domain-containing protein n=1 Tax=Parastrongyloides trichosuri TaxID=131310 RepID=A0A0N4ZAY9_PARTI